MVEEKQKQIIPEVNLIKKLTVYSGTIRERTGQNRPTLPEGLWPVFQGSRFAASCHAQPGTGRFFNPLRCVQNDKARGGDSGGLRPQATPLTNSCHSDHQQSVNNSAQPLIQYGGTALCPASWEESPCNKQLSCSVKFLTRDQPVTGRFFTSLRCVQNDKAR